MAEIVLFGHEFGFGGDGKNIGAKSIKTQTAKKTWEVTVEEKKKCISEFYKKRTTTHGGPFPAGSKQTIADFVCQNVGGADGGVYFKADRIDTNGNVVRNIMNCNGGGFIVGYGASFNINKEVDSCDTADGGPDPDAIKQGHVVTNVPSEPGTYYYGMKTWGSDESEPPYPSPTAAIHEGKVVFPTAIPQLEPWQWATVGVATLVGIGIGYVASKELL